MPVSTNHKVELSEDNSKMIITAVVDDNERRDIYLRAKDEPFTEDDREQVESSPYRWSEASTGEIRRAHLFQLGEREIIVSFNTGPPTWWKPRFIREGKIERKQAFCTERFYVREYGIGWLRALLAAAIYTPIILDSNAEIHSTFDITNEYY